MDDFVCNKLTEWGLSQYIEIFKDEEIDEDSLYCLEDEVIEKLIPKEGPKAKFKKNLKSLKLQFSVMDVRSKLTEWGLSQYIDKFKDEEIDEDSFYCLEDEAIDKLIPKEGPKAKFKKNLKSLKYQQQHEEAADSAQVLPSTSNASDEGKRKLDLQDQSSIEQSPTKRRCGTVLGSNSEEILSDMEKIMECVKQKLPNQENNKLTEFLKKKISDLDTDKRELVGVFGKTGAGKSSLINAVIGQKNLLPPGSISACTTIMIKVEANMQNSKYEADIEFITKEDWTLELNTFLGYNADQQRVDDDDDDDSDYCDFKEKLSALYGEEWNNQSPESLMDSKYFREIPEFLNSGRKILPCKTAEELSAKCVKYTRTNSQDGDVKRWYWPLVKCVTVRVPKNDLLKHITFVDLPDNRDCNKSRDEMWKEVVGRCSTVWIVTDINRAESEKEPWEILENASSLMGNGGECQQICFICTKSDQIEDFNEHSATDVPARIHERNSYAREAVRKKFNKQNMLKNHFSNDCLKVFTVSSKEFLNRKYLKEDETEIPKLQDFLRNLTDRHSVTLNYASGARGILSLIQGTHRREVADQKTDVCTNLEEKMKPELDKVRKPMEEAYETFKKRLSEGVEKSRSSCERVVHSVINPRNIKGFHKTLKCIVENGGIHKTQKGKHINLNMTLASCLTDSINEDFRRTFPNDRKHGPFNGVINNFSLGTERLIEEYKDVELQLIFLKSEEEKIKTKLNEEIRERKKRIYNSLTTTIQETMAKCYEKAARFTGTGTLENMRVTVRNHVHVSKDTMFEHAKDVMLEQLRDLKEEILETLEETMQKAIELSLKTDDYSLPDVSEDLDKMTEHYNKLKQVTRTDPAGPAAARP